MFIFKLFFRYDIPGWLGVEKQSLSLSLSYFVLHSFRKPGHGCWLQVSVSFRCSAHIAPPKKGPWHSRSRDLWPPPQVWEHSDHSDQSPITPSTATESCVRISFVQAVSLGEPRPSFFLPQISPNHQKRINGRIECVAWRKSLLFNMNTIVGWL